MQLELMGRADEIAWVERIRRYLELNSGRASHQRQHDDPSGTYSLLA